jgi:hypothetical protein
MSHFHFRVLPVIAAAGYLVAPAVLAQSNDFFANRTRLSGDNIVAPSVSGTGGGRETGEPVHPRASANPSATLWWEWVAPQTATYTIDTAGSAFDTVLAVYEGTALNQLRRVAGNDNPIGGNLRARVTLTTTAGTAYQIVVASGGSTTGNVALAIAYVGPATAPSFTGTDNFNDRPRITGDAFLGQAEATNASDETGEPSHPRTANNRSHWWQWTAPSAGNVVIDLAGQTMDSAELDTVLNVYVGTELNRLDRVRLNDNAIGSNFASRVSFPAAAGQVYQIVASPGSGFTGNFRLSLTLSTASAQPDALVGTDDFYRRPTVTGNRALGVGETTTATRQTGEPSHAGVGAAGRTLWWQWVAPANGTLVLDTLDSVSSEGGLFDTVLLVYSGGPEINQIALLGENNDGPGRLTSRLQLNVTAGTACQIVVAPRGGGNGNVLLALDFTPTPAETGRLANLSVRTTAGTGAQTLIAGFVVNGAGGRQLLVRTIGPALTAFGVSGVLDDPTLSILKAGAPFAANDNWGGGAELAATFVSVGAFPLPVASRDAALAAGFEAGSYTAQVAGAGGSTGIALLELYDAGGDPGARLANVSTRTQVGTGGGILIAGLNIVDGPRTVIIRAIGPTLGSFGVGGVLADPRLELFDARQVIVASNDDWDARLAGAFAGVGAFPLPERSLDAALRVTLQPGSYTAQVSGVAGRTGVALVEIYEVP